jgi:hypothetical protein
LDRQVRLSATEAVAMTRDLPFVSIDPIRATFACPGSPGRVILIAFAYANRPTVGLWYDVAGCPTLDNGHVVADAAGHPSFYDHFTKRVEALLR